MVSLAEIAREAGEAKTTVSRVLSHDSTLTISEETKAKIIAVAKTRGYQVEKENA